MFSKGDIILPLSPTIKDIALATYDIFRSNHFVSYDYTSTEPVKYMSKPIEEAPMQQLEYLRVMLYGSKLFESIENNTSIKEFLDNDRACHLKLGTFLYNELVNAEQEGGLCHYISIVMYWILKTISFKDASNRLKYVQGFYHHILREDFPQFIPMNKNQQGLHCWLTIDNSVIDVTIGQQRSLFDFKTTSPFIFGNIPDGLDYYGFPESNETCYKYALKYSEKASMDFTSWVSKHIMACDLCSSQLFTSLFNNIAL